MVGLLGSLALWQSAEAQVVMPVNPKGKDPKDKGPRTTSSISMQIDNEIQKNMDRIWNLVANEKWEPAVEDLQLLLDRKNDGYVQRKNANGDYSEKAVSFRFEANKLLKGMPLEGLKCYEGRFGADAAGLLDRVKSADATTEKRRLLAELMQRYLHTKAGAQALEMVATDCLERGNHQEAALRFKQLLDLKNAEAPTAQTLLKASLAFARFQDKSINRDDILKSLHDKAAKENGVKIGKDPVDLLVVKADQIDEEVLRNFQPTLINQSESPLYRVNPARVGQAVGGAPDLTPSWSVSLLPGDKHKAWVEGQIKKATDYLQGVPAGKNLPVMPGFFPIAANGKIIFRTYSGIYVVNLRKDLGSEERNSWNTTDGGVEAVREDPTRQPSVESWKNEFDRTGPHSLIFENSLIGSVSTDGTRAYVVDDLCLPPYNGIMMRRGGGVQPVGGNNPMSQNSLKAYNLESMKLLWDLGGKEPTHVPALDALKGGFFIGPPLPLAGKLYVLHEKNNELFLLCLEPKDKDERLPPPPDLVWAQKLVKTRDGIETDFNRRIHAAHLSYGEGMLVCPTNAGAMLGVDLLSHSLVWVNPYREGVKEEAPPNPFQPGFVQPGMQPISNRLLNEWKVSAPAIVDGKVLFTAPDGNALHCQSLHSEEELWKAPKLNSDVYFAGVFDGKAIIVGVNSVRAIDINASVALKQAKEAWSIPNTGMPSGQGVASDNIYYLPVKKSAKKSQPEVLAIDLTRGVILGPTAASATKSDGKTLQEPGNLIFYEGQLISQTVDSLISYPQVTAKMAQIDERLKKDPRDLRALAERGELRLGKGELRLAIEDLHAALDILTPNPTTDETRALQGRVNHKLYDTISLLVDRDFDQAEKYLPEYEALCKVGDAEEQFRRQSDFLSRVARGRERQGRLVDAFDAYLSFGALVGDRKLVSVSDQPSTEARPDVWARGRIGAMMAKATPEQRRPLEERIAERWAGLRDSKELKPIEDFVSLFGSAFEVGKQAKLALAERLMADDQPEKIVESQRKAQLLLLQLRDMRGAETDALLVGQAIDALGRLMENKKEYAHAAAYKKELGRDFAKVVLRDGLTGGDICNQMFTDKRYSNSLEAPRPAWKGDFEGTGAPGNFALQPHFAMEPIGEVLPFFHKHRLTLDGHTGRLRVVERATSKVYWETPDLMPLQNLFAVYMQQRGGVHADIRFTYQAKGHIVVFQLAHVIFAFDLVEKKKLWEYNLYEPETANAPQNGSLWRDNHDGNYYLLYPDGFKQRLGQPGPLQANYVCLQTRKGLVALDPVLGPAGKLWTKTDVSPRSEIFGDDRHIFLVDVNADGLPISASRAVRASDGVTVAVPEFIDLYKKEKRLHVRGGTLLARDTNAKGEPVIRLYDCAAGKDLWSRAFPLKSTLLVSDNADLTGAVDPEGQLTVVQVSTQRELLKTTVKKEQVAALTNAHLLNDRDNFYVVLNHAAKPIEGATNEPQRNVFAGMGTLDVNGAVYAFDRAAGKTRWAIEVANQKLVLEQFQDSPVLFFTVKYFKQDPQFGQRWFHAAEAFNKNNGKCVWPRPEMKEQPVPGNNYMSLFHALDVNPASQTVEFTQINYKMTFKLKPSEVK